MRKRLVLSLSATAVAGGLVTAGGAIAEKGPKDGGGAKPAAYTIPGDKVFPEGISREPGSRSFFVTSTTDGTVFKGDLGSPAMTAFSPAGLDGRTTAIGLKADGRGNLVVAGGDTGKIFVLSSVDGKTKKVLDTGVTGRDKTFLNDVAISKGYAYVTDSVQKFLFRVKLGKDGSVGELEKFVSFEGTAFAYGEGFNANGIAIDEGGEYAVIVQSGTGKLFRVGLRDKAVSEVDLGGATVTNGDGLLIKGSTLYVARNMQELIVPVKLGKRGTTGAVGAGVTGPQLQYPTTIALDGNRILAVGSQFDKRSAMAAPELPFKVATIAKPKVQGGHGGGKHGGARKASGRR